MKVIEVAVKTTDLKVVNYCCGDMKYHINAKRITFSATAGFFIFGTYGFSHCPFCGRKIDYK